MLLRKFIYHPVVLASLDQDYFGSFTRDTGTSKRDEHEWKTVAAFMSMASRDFVGAICSAGKNLFQFVGILRSAYAVAEQDRAVFEVSGLPRVHESVRGCQGKHVAGVCGIGLLGGMAMRSSPEWGR
jgi:hypothetical protein